NTVWPIRAKSGTPRQYQLGLLEFLHRRVAALAHDAAQRAEEVALPAGVARRTDDDLLETRRGRVAPRKPDDGRARYPRMSGGSVPVPPGTGRFGGRRKRVPEHDRVGTTCERFGDVSAGHKVAICDEMHISATGFIEVVAPGRRRIH